MNLLLDMDGVLVDFVGRACELHNTTPDQIPWADCGFTMEKGLGLTTEEFWAPLDEDPFGFWEGLDPYPWYIDLLTTCEVFAHKHGGNVYLCTTPSLNPYSQAGKIAWAQKHLPHHLQRRFVFTPHKHLLARPNAVLVDDGDHNLEPFKEAGGEVVRFAQPWNKGAYRLPKSDKERVDYVKRGLSMVARGEVPYGATLDGDGDE